MSKLYISYCIIGGREIGKYNDFVGGAIRIGFVWFIDRYELGRFHAVIDCERRASIAFEMVSNCLNQGFKLHTRNTEPGCFVGWLLPLVTGVCDEVRM